MNIIGKIKDIGLSGCIYAVKYRTVNRVIKFYNNILFKKYEKFPIDEHSIVLESEGDCCDNAYALFDYMKQKGYVGKYKITWLVDYPKHFRDEENVKYLRKNIYEHFASKTIKALGTCKWYIYDHSDLMKGQKRKNQTVIFLNHGGGFKSPTCAPFSFADETYTPSKLFYYPALVCWGCAMDKILDIGFPRLDYFYRENDDRHNLFTKCFDLDKYKKVFLWMPTFRKSVHKQLTEAYFKSETGLPILYRDNELEELNNVLKKNNSLCIFKVHHLQAKMKENRRAQKFKTLKN